MLFSFSFFAFSSHSVLLYILVRKLIDFCAELNLSACVWCACVCETKGFEAGVHENTNIKRMSARVSPSLCYSPVTRITPLDAYNSKIIRQPVFSNIGTVTGARSFIA